MVNLRFWEKTVVAERVLGADHVKSSKISEDKGKVDTSYGGSWEGRVEHPNNMANYEKWACDAESNMAINVLTDIIAGVGFHTEMPDQKDSDEKHPSLKIVDEYAETVNLDEDLEEITSQMLSKGFCPAEKTVGYDGQTDLKILPSETFYYYRDKKGNVLKYTQEETTHNPITTWAGKEMQDVILFMHRKTPRRPYGFSLLEPIGSLIDGRNDLNRDVIKGVHRWANPIPLLEFSKSKEMSQEAKKSVEDRDVDEWVFFYNVMKDEMRSTILTVDPSTRFIPYVELIYYQICEGLHAPLLLYLKNATEASATVMMESVDRLVNGVQRYIKRRVERYLYKPLTGEPVPRHIWGKPQTGLEKVTMTELAALVNSQALANNQKQKLLKDYGVQLPDPDWKSGPPLPTLSPFGGEKKPFGQEKPAPKVEILDQQMVERLNDLDLGLEIIANNFDTGRLNVPEASKMAYRSIEVHMKRNNFADWETRTQERWRRFMAEKMVTH